MLVMLGCIHFIVVVFGAVLAVKLTENGLLRRRHHFTAANLYGLLLVRASCGGCGTALQRNRAYRGEVHRAQARTLILVAATVPGFVVDFDVMIEMIIAR